MSDEKYFQNLDETEVRPDSGPFFSFPEIEEPRPPEVRPERLQLNVKSIRKYLREMNPHGD